MPRDHGALVRESLIAVGATLLALLIRFALDPFVGDQFPFLTFLVAAAIVPLFAGTLPALACIALGGLAANWFFMSPRYSFTFGDMSQHVGSWAYLMLSLTFVGFGRALRGARRRAEDVSEGLVREMAERRQTQEQLRVSEERLRLAQQAAGIGAFEWNITTGVNTWTRELEAMYGLAPGTFSQTQQDWKDLVHPQDRPHVLAGIEESLKTGQPVEREFRVCWPDGSTHWLMGRWQSVADEAGLPFRLIGVNIDVTERKQAEQALRESHQRYELVLAGAEAGIWDWDVVRQRVMYSSRWKAMRGFAEDEVTDAEAEWREGIHPDDVSRVMQAVQAHFEGKTAVFAEEYRVRRKDGAWMWVADRGLARRDQEGRVIRMAGSEIDITVRKEAEEELRRWKDELERRVEERTREVVQSQQRLRALATELNLTEQRERQRLATELHDHLQQLLVLAKLKLGQGKALAVSLPSCAEAIQQGDEAIGEALTYTRTLVAELSPPILREFGLTPALRWLAEWMGRHHLTVRIEADGCTDVSLPEDQAVLAFQSVRELLMNVIKHSGCDRAVLAISQQRDRLLIQVRDEGRGFDPIAAAADQNQSADSPRFGLFSIRERMRALGGWFDVESAPDKGTTATLVLPLDTGAAGSAALQGPPLVDMQASRAVPQPSLVEQPTSRPSPPAVAPGQAHKEKLYRVLLTDDHAMFRQGLRSVLESYQEIDIVGEASNGAEAVDLVTAVKPSVVVMDINMPTMNGIEATAKIKRDHPDVAVIGLSVNADEKVKEAMAKAGASAMLSKEAVAEHLYRTIQHCAGLGHVPR
jgi:PAS domain S-box-containing protein